MTQCPPGTAMKEVVCNAIATKKLLSFMYEGLGRVVEPRLCGQNAAGHGVLLAWLVRGHSKSDPRPGWRNYLLAEMQSLHVLDETFERSRPGFKPHDTRMVTIYCRVEATGENRR